MVARDPRQAGPLLARCHAVFVGSDRRQDVADGPARRRMAGGRGAQWRWTWRSQRAATSTTSTAASHHRRQRLWGFRRGCWATIPVTSLGSAAGPGRSCRSSLAGGARGFRGPSPSSASSGWTVLGWMAARPRNRPARLRPVCFAHQCRQVPCGGQCRIDGGQRRYKAVCHLIDRRLVLVRLPSAVQVRQREVR